MSGRVTVGGLIGLASQTCALTVDEIKGGDRHRQFIRARMAVVHYAIEAGFNLSRIGRVLGGRDHNTIANLRDKGKIWRGLDPLFDRIMDAMGEGVAAGKADQVAMSVVPPIKPSRKDTPDEIDLADRLMHYEMRAASDTFLRALRQAA